MTPVVMGLVFFSLMCWISSKKRRRSYQFRHQLHLLFGYYYITIGTQNSNVISSGISFASPPPPALHPQPTLLITWHHRHHHVLSFSISKRSKQNVNLVYPFFSPHPPHTFHHSCIMSPHTHRVTNIYTELGFSGLSLSWGNDQTLGSPGSVFFKFSHS
ncbi:hypothetical protein BDB00DRAFT_824755 [Zychaea mexicana]|uniref:uncharacterized protein n=1 Tax=Zychaea mexicana TaxID=64656 RepID=UPI0022FF0FA5|nr:uncharacterized protein BDB00DRAFT_824755 [Zychaea mexicana]KAI9493190.1 hypothetical protein BDB00DRAFT_824755 [Zychaea mexicana]